MVKKKIICIIQARNSSTRFPGKILKKVNKNLTVLEILIKRLRKSNLISQIVVASTNNSLDNEIIKVCRNINVNYFRGSEYNVLDRYYNTAKKFKADIIVRITSDCPLTDPILVDQFIKTFIKKKNIDFLSNTIERTFPDGLDIEIFNKKALKLAFEKSVTSYEKEHVTPFLKKTNKIKKYNIKHKKDFSSKRWTIDYKEDLELIKFIIKYFSPNIYFDWKKILTMEKNNKKIFKKSIDLKRTADLSNNSGQTLYNDAKKIIPGGNMFLSKRPEMYLPDLWPAYFKESKGCKVKDLDGKSYYDMTMGVGTNILGYANNKVDEEVKKGINKGIMSTLNCPEEVYLAKKLIKIHEWAGGVKFARTGGEANALSIRIARSFTKKTKIAICGYHGWHDWYLSANLNKKDNLSTHLLSDLHANGVPKGLKNTVFPFRYKKFNELLKIVKKNDIGVIVMEFSRSLDPDINFIKKIRNLATKKNIVLIFDECTSGFRQNFGGLHKLYKINPDMAIFGKCLGNGYAISAIIGKKKIMESSQTSFISSTFWSERVGFIASLKTLEVMEKIKSWKTITKMGFYVRKKLKYIAKKNKIKIKIWGLPALTGYTIVSDYNNYFKTYITQEMLKNGFISGNCIYLCINHNRKILDKYFSVLNLILKKIKTCNTKNDIQKLLQGPVAHTTFRRLN